MAAAAKKKTAGGTYLPGISTGPAPTGYPGADPYVPGQYTPSQIPDQTDAAPVDNSGGGSGGGGGTYDPTTDPTYAAYIANLDLQLAQQQSNTERQRQALLGQQDQNLYDSGVAGDQSRQNISGNYESRGLFNSGGRLRDISQQQADQGVREGRIRQGTTTGISDLENALAQAQAHTQLLKQNASLGVFQ